jgi:DNA repair ATPase RecN
MRRRIAWPMGNDMASPRGRDRVVTMTRSPEGAAEVDRPGMVEKNIAGGRTWSHIYPMNDEEWGDEIARVPGGVGKSARDLAINDLER